MEIEKCVIDMAIWRHLELFLQSFTQLIFIRPDSLKQIYEQHIFVVLNHLTYMLLEGRNSCFRSSFNLRFSLEACLLPVKWDRTSDLGIG